MINDRDSSSLLVGMKMIPWQYFYTIEETMNDQLSEKVASILSQLSVVVGVPANELNHPPRNHQGSNEKNMDSFPTIEIRRSHSIKRDPSLSTNKNSHENHHRESYSPKERESKKDEMDWENVRKKSDFKSTKIERKKGIEQTINEIRILLNKITDKNYAKLRDEMIEKIHSIPKGGSEVCDQQVSVEDSEEMIHTLSYRKVAHHLFEIASTNKFFSKMYAQLYSELMNESTIYSEIAVDFAKSFMNQVEKIAYVNPDKDYDGYCAYVKSQDSRRATAGFMIHLAYFVSISMKDIAIVLWEEIQSMLRLITEKIETQMDEEGKTNEVEERMEILFLLVTGGGKEKMGGLILETDMVNNWKRISQCKVKEHPSWSSRALFKIGDLVKLVG